jgi:predicted subunit of tRNA(5-methylaminomethyl-2-thiouridylate) methyltransferase
VQKLHEVAARYLAAAVQKLHEVAARYLAAVAKEGRKRDDLLPFCASRGVKKLQDYSNPL